MLPILFLSPMKLHVLLCGICWVLLCCFAVLWNRLIRRSGLPLCCVISDRWGSWRCCVPPVSCRLLWMQGQLLLELQCNQGVVGFVSLCLLSGSLTVKRLHWLDITRWCLPLVREIETFHTLAGWTSCPSYWGAAQLIVEWHTAYLFHILLGYLDMSDVVSFIFCDWIAYGTLLYTVALIDGLVFYCSPSRAWCQCIVVHPILMWRCSFS